MNHFSLLLPLSLALSACVSTPAPSLPLEPEPAPAGLVDWHSGGFEAAKQASVLSGRPVLLFELFGNLDELFC